MSDIKTRLQKALKNKGLSISQFAKKVGIPQDRIYKWYQQGTQPKPDDLLILENWLKNLDDLVDVDQLKNAENYNVQLAVLFDVVCEILAQQKGISPLQVRRELLQRIEDYHKI